MATAFLFPGQGAQTVGMGKDVHDASQAAGDLFDQAEHITGLELRTLCFEGPQEQLSRTDIAQPAIFTVSAAMLAALGESMGTDAVTSLAPGWMAGLSLGEYTALYAAGAMDFADGVKLVARRGELMQQAASASSSGMLSVLGLDEAQAQALCEAAAEGQVLTCANFNCPGQIVLSGETTAIGRAEKLADEYGAKGAVRLDVAGAFHCELMQPAADRFAEELANVTFREPAVTVLANVDARPHGGPDEIRSKLLEQLTCPVRWQQSMESLLAGGADRFIEIGPGRVLAGLMRRIQRRADFTSVNSLEAVRELAGDGS